MKPCMVLLVMMAFAAQARAGEDSDPLLLLLPLPAPAPQGAVELGDLTRIAPGIFSGAKVVMLEGVTLIETGPVDGMEVFACLDGGKAHEAMIRLLTGNGQLVKFAVIQALGCEDGVPAEESSGIPARGTPVRVLVQWRDARKEGAWLQLDASCLVRDRVTDAPYPALPFIYTGSRMMEVSEPGPGGKMVRRQRFMLDATKSVVVGFDEPDSLFASPFPGADTDQRFEANSAVTPRPGTEVRLVFAPAKLPLTLELDKEGGLRPQGGGDLLGDEALGVLFAQHYGESLSPDFRAVAITVVDASTPRELDVAVRRRLLAIAAATRCWVVPVFVIPANPHP